MTEPGPGRRIRVLLVDDSVQLLSAVGELVRSRPGMELVGVATDAAAGMAALPVARPDVVLLDVRMPGGGGVRVAREISARWPGVAIVALTAHGDPSTMAEMRAAGAVAHLVKGVHTVAQIEAAIRLAAAGPPHAASAILGSLRPAVRTETGPGCEGMLAADTSPVKQEMERHGSHERASDPGDGGRR